MRRAKKRQVSFGSLATGIGFLVVTAIMVTVPWLMLVGTPKAATDLAPSPTATRYGAFQPTASPTSEPEDLGTSSPPEEPRVHVVQPGDSLYGLAQRYGTTVEAIAEANGITDPRRLSVGQELVIP